MAPNISVVEKRVAVLHFSRVFCMAGPFCGRSEEYETSGKQGLVHFLILRGDL